MCSIVLFSCCAEVLKILKFTSDFQTAFPNYSKEQYKQIIAVVMETFGKTLDGNISMKSILVFFKHVM